MLPIDERAKSGVLVYVQPNHDLSLRRVRYDPDTDTFDEPNGDFWTPEQLTGRYLPAPLVENAAKMREALHGLFVGCRGADTAALRILAATEWPEVKGE